MPLVTARNVVREGNVLSRVCLSVCSHLYLLANGWLAFDWKVFLLLSATKLWRLCFYTCLSFCSRGGCLPQCMLGYHPPGKHTPPGSNPPVKHPPPPETAAIADGTHPTGMHSCFKAICCVQLFLNIANGLWNKYAPTWTIFKTFERNACYKWIECKVMKKAPNAKWNKSLWKMIAGCLFHFYGPT